MCSGETGELFLELSSVSCPKCDGVLYAGTNHICLKKETTASLSREHLQDEAHVNLRGEDNCETCDSHTANKPETTTEKVTHHFSCTQPNGEIFAAGVEHMCFAYIGEKVYDVSTNSYQCVFCNQWCQAGIIHTCGKMYNEQQSSAAGYTCTYCKMFVDWGEPHTCLLTDQRMDRLENKLDKLIIMISEIHKHVGAPHWVTGRAKEFLTDIMGKETEVEYKREYEGSWETEAEIVNRWILEYEYKFGSDRTMCATDVLIRHILGWVKRKGKGKT